MDTHARGSAKSGTGAVVVQRGLDVLRSMAPGTYPLLTTEGPAKDFPVLIECIIATRTPFDATGVSITVQIVAAGGGTSNFLVDSTLAANTSVTKSFLSLTRGDQVNIIYVAGTTGTTGHAGVFVRYAGTGAA